jgi:hypothetical protein
MSFLNREERRFLRGFGIKGKGLIKSIIRDYLRIRGEIPEGLTEEEYFSKKVEERLKELEEKDRKGMGYRWMKHKYDEKTLRNWIVGRKLELLTLDCAKYLAKLDSRGKWHFKDNGKNLGKGADIIMERGNEVILAECKNFVHSKFTRPIAGETENRFESSISKLGLKPKTLVKLLILRGKATNPAYRLLSRDYGAKIVMLGDYLNIEMLMFYLFMFMGIVLSSLENGLYVFFYGSGRVLCGEPIFWLRVRLRSVWAGLRASLGSVWNIFRFLRTGGCGRLVGDLRIMRDILTDRDWGNAFLKCLDEGGVAY